MELRKSLTFHKKGQNIVSGMIFLILVLMIFGMVSLFGWQAFSDISTDITNDVTSNESKAVINDIDTRYPSVMDGLFMLLFILVWAAVIISAFFSDQHPILFGLMLILVIFVLIASAMIANYFEETFQDDSMTSISTNFPMTMFIMNHLLEIAGVVTLTIVLALMGKNRAR